MNLDAFRTGRAYTVPEAARLAGIHPSTAHGWLHGYSSEGEVRSEPVFRRDAKSPWVSFLELAEVIIVAKFRREKVPLRTLRRAHRFASEKWRQEYPFASMKLLLFGPHVLHEFRETHPTKANLVSLDQENQLVLPGIVAKEIRHFDYEDDEQQLAERWFPYGKDIPIVVDPHYGAGRPTVVGCGVRVETLKKRNKAGQDIDSLASDFMLDAQIVRKVLTHAA